MKKKTKIKENLKNYLDEYSKWVPPKICTILATIVFVLLVTICRFQLNNDFWFLINTGKYILNNGIPTIEPFTIHANLEFIAQQWLADVIFYLVFSNFGIYGMYVLILSISVLIVSVIYKISKLISNNKFKIPFLITNIVYVLLGLNFITTRPQIFDITLLLMELYLLELWFKKQKEIYLIGLPIISIFMINLHSSLWLMIFILLLPYYVELIINLRKHKRELKKILLITLIMLLVGLINPYGLDAMKYLFNSYGVDTINNLVSEMFPITISKYLTVYAYIFLVLVSFYYNKGNNKIRYILLTLGTCYLALSHARGIMFFLISSVLTLSHNFKELFNEKQAQQNFYLSKPLNHFVVITFISFFGMYMYNLCTTDIKEKNTPYLYNLVNYLDKNTTKDIKIYTGYNDGGYLEYRGYKCYLDPRAEVFLKSNNKKEDILFEYATLQNYVIHYKKFLDKYNFDYLVVSENDILYTYIDENYEIVYEEKIKNIFENDEINYRIYKKIN